MNTNSYSKFRNTFLSMYDYNSPTTASGSKNSVPPTTSETLKRMLSDKKKPTNREENQLKQDASYINTLINSKIHDVNTVSISSWNGKPLMIKVGNENKGIIEYNNFLRQASKTPVSVDLKQDVIKIMEKNKNDENDPNLIMNQQLNALKIKFVQVLDGYKKREQILVERCKYLETELLKTQESRQNE